MKKSQQCKVRVPFFHMTYFLALICRSWKFEVHSNLCSNSKLTIWGSILSTMEDKSYVLYKGWCDLIYVKIMLEGTREDHELRCSTVTLNYNRGNENGGHELIQDNWRCIQSISKFYCLEYYTLVLYSGKNNDLGLSSWVHCSAIWWDRKLKKEGVLDWIVSSKFICCNPNPLYDCIWR